MTSKGQECMYCGKPRPKDFWGTSDSWHLPSPQCGAPHCAVCGTRLPMTMPAHARFCSGKCRAKAWREAHAST